MITADYLFYCDSCRGTLSEGVYGSMSVLAFAYLERCTQGRVLEPLSEALTQKVNLAHCRLVDVFYQNIQGGAVASESNDGISVTYESTQTTADGRLWSAVKLFLGGTGLLYRGVG